MGRRRSARTVWKKSGFLPVSSNRFFRPARMAFVALTAFAFAWQIRARAHTCTFKSTPETGA